MYRRPLSLLLSSCLFLVFPLEAGLKWFRFGTLSWTDVAIEMLLPLAVLIGLLHVSRIGWYTLVAFIALWGIRDLYQYYARSGGNPLSLWIHLSVYMVSIAYFINPRIRHLYFDPKLRWWRTKPRYETHLPLVVRHQEDWHYPVLRNMSEGGCFIESSHLLDVSAPVYVSIPLPVPLGVSVIKTRGEVRWVSNNPMKMGMGVQFVDTLPQHLRAIRIFLDEQL